MTFGSLTKQNPDLLGVGCALQARSYAKLHLSHHPSTSWVMEGMGG